MSQSNEGQDRIDYRETSDVTEVHAAYLREHQEPSAEVTPIPTWLSLVSAAALCWAGLYVGFFHGGFSPKIYSEFTSPLALFAKPEKKGKAGAVAAELSLAQIGEGVYKSNCAACHQPNGMGTPGTIPPLAGSEWVDGSEANEKRLISMVLKGLQGPVTVKGATYNGAMPPWESLGNKKVAAVLTYIRQGFGNKAGEITEAQVAAVKKEVESQTTPFTVDQIKAIPVDTKVEGGAAAAPVAALEANAAPAAGVPVATPIPTPAPAAAFDLTESIARGKGFYMLACGACHQPTGLGMPGAFPPLAGSEYVIENERRLIAITLKGVSGPIKVAGKDFNSMMLPPETMFAGLKEDGKLADVLNYVRNSFGNKVEKPITPEMVAAARKEFAERTTPWTEAELLNFPAPK